MRIRSGPESTNPDNKAGESKRFNQPKSGFSDDHDSVAKYKIDKLTPHTPWVVSQQNITNGLVAGSDYFARVGDTKRARIYELAAIRAKQRLKTLQAVLDQSKGFKDSQKQANQRIRDILNGDDTGKAA